MIALDVLARLGARLTIIPGLNILVGEVGSVQIPAAIVGLPDITFDDTYGRGSDVMDLAVMVVEANPKSADTWLRLLPYADGAGARSVKVALQTPAVGEVPAFAKAHVARCEFDEVSIGGMPYAAAIFPVQVKGSGA